MKNALYNVLQKCAEEMGGTSTGLEEFIKKFPSPTDYVLGYKIISSKSENKKVLLKVMVDVDLKSLREIFIKEGIIKRMEVFPKVSIDVNSESNCANISFGEVKDFLERISKTEFPDYFGDTEKPDYQVTLSLNGEKKETDGISWCAITMRAEIRHENETILEKNLRKSVYRFSSEVYPREVSDSVKEMFFQAVKAIEKDWEERGNIKKIMIRTHGWIPVNERENVKKILIQNFPSFHSINLVFESSQNVEFMCTFAGPSEGIIERLISIFNSNGWEARKITEEIIEVKMR